MVAPPDVQLFEELLATERLNLGHYLSPDEFRERLRVPLVEFCLKCFDWSRAQVVN